MGGRDDTCIGASGGMAILELVLLTFAFGGGGWRDDELESFTR
jgi:hypothetical protein